MYALKITAKDQGIPARSAIVTATITVSDVNHFPVFVPASPANISDDKPVNTLVTQARAIDPDTGSGLNGEIMYSISGGNDEGLFKISTVCIA